MSCTRKEIVSIMQQWVGLKESDGSHKQIIDIYNSIKPLPVGYKLKYTDAWCAGCVSAAAQAAGAAEIFPTECSCPRQITKAKNMGIWVERDDYVPLPGDCVVYEWSDSGAGECASGADHVGMVEKVEGNTITVIEGNYSNAVKRRTLQVNGRYIRGWITPKYDADGAEKEENAETSPEPVKYTQEQFVRDVQAATGAEVDGIAGPETIGKTVTVSRYINRKHAVVKPIQKWLYTLGYTVVGEADGVAGPLFAKAMKAYQKDNGCIADGEATKKCKTWRKLLGMA